MKPCKSCKLLKNNNDFYSGRSECKACVAVRSKLWRESNPEVTRAYNSKYRRDRRARDPMFKMITSMRTRTYIAFKTAKFHKDSKFSEYIGCSAEQLKKHIESQFLPEMCWENYGKWHVDHKYPLSLAKNEKELLELCHFKNLQPMWGSDNIVKRNRLNL